MKERLKTAALILIVAALAADWFWYYRPADIYTLSPALAPRSLTSPSSATEAETISKTAICGMKREPRDLTKPWRRSNPYLPPSARQCAVPGSSLPDGNRHPDLYHG